MEKNILDDIKRVIEKPIETIVKDGVSSNNLDYLYKLVDIHKDIANEEYWKAKEEKFMRYDGYGRGYGRDAYGEGSYGRRSRDSRGRYTGHRPEDRIDEMYMNYQAYSEGREAYGRSGNYSAKEDSMKSLEFMLESAVDLFKMLKEEASSQEEVEMIKKYAHKISEM